MQALKEVKCYSGYYWRNGRERPAEKLKLKIEKHSRTAKKSKKKSRKKKKFKKVLVQGEKINTSRVAGTKKFV